MAIYWPKEGCTLTLHGNGTLRILETEFGLGRWVCDDIMITVNVLL